MRLCPAYNGANFTAELKDQSIAEPKAHNIIVPKARSVR